jgi:hypothetical protein
MYLVAAAPPLRPGNASGQTYPWAEEAAAGRTAMTAEPLANARGDPARRGGVCCCMSDFK